MRRETKPRRDRTEEAVKKFSKQAPSTNEKTRGTPVRLAQPNKEEIDFVAALQNAGAGYDSSALMRGYQRKH